MTLLEVLQDPDVLAGRKWFRTVIQPPMPASKQVHKVCADGQIISYGGQMIVRGLGVGIFNVAELIGAWEIIDPAEAT